VHSLATQASLSLTHKHHNSTFNVIVSFIQEKHFFYKTCVAQFKKVIRCCRCQFAAALTPDKETKRGSQPLTDRMS
jgi:hypothetical protein